MRCLSIKVCIAYTYNSSKEMLVKQLQRDVAIKFKRGLDTCVQGYPELGLVGSRHQQGIPGVEFKSLVWM